MRTGKKKLIWLVGFVSLATGLSVAGCAKDATSSDGPPDNENQPPTGPSTLYGQALTDTSIYLNWHDNSTNETGFVIFRGQLADPAPIDTVPANQRFYTNNGLEPLSPYTYYVVAVNSYGESQPSNFVTVTTLSSNHPPRIPSNPSPPDGSADQRIDVNISWQASDPDEDDTLSFDLYFGPAGATIPLIATDLSTGFYDLSILEYSTVYNWRVVVYDSFGDSAIGPVWSFETTVAPWHSNSPRSHLRCAIN